MHYNIIIETRAMDSTRYRAQVAEGGPAWLATEYVDGSSHRDAYEKLRENVRASVGANAVDFLHVPHGE